MILKESIKEALLKRDFDFFLNHTEPNKLMRILLSISYDKTDILAWRAIETIGILTSKISSRDPEFGRNLVRKLLWSIRDEAGGIGWSSPEILGEIVRNDIERYPEIPGILWSFMDEDFLRKGIIWATGRIGEVSPGAMNFAIPYLKELLEDQDPEIRFYSAWALCKMGISVSVNEEIEEYIYEDGMYERVNIKDILKECDKGLYHYNSHHKSIVSHKNLKDMINDYTGKRELKEGFSGRCPYCGERIDKPDTIKMEFGDFLGGRCGCGAVYGYDPSGRALGEVYIDVLALLCDGDYNKAISMEEGRDYIIRETGYEPLLGYMGGDAHGLYSRRMIFVKMLRR